MKHSSWMVKFQAATPARAEAIAKERFTALAARDPQYAQHEAMVLLAIASMPTKVDHQVSVYCSGLIDTRNGNASAKIELLVELVLVEA